MSDTTGKVSVFQHEIFVSSGNGDREGLPSMVMQAIPAKQA
ncbi:hypothetical protein CKA32_006975 [Geitlerinema sp. FC II]|nr:hypothetical protein CKA32_006975 [Geitlerinema sp. FC II]